MRYSFVTMPGVGRHRRVDTGDGQFRLLFVCTGNICRSPYAQILTRHLLVGRLGGRGAGQFEVASAGVSAVVGAPMHPLSRAQLGRWGLEGATARQFVARQLNSSMIRPANLVLGASPEHRSAVVGCEPAALSTAFSLREFARLAGSVDERLLPVDPVARAHALVEEARQLRGLIPPADAEDDRIPDPMGQTAVAHQQVAMLITDALEAIVDVIAPPMRAVSSS
jgi:protein-tyrosine phosphatase